MYRVLKGILLTPL